MKFGTNSAFNPRPLPTLLPFLIILNLFTILKNVQARSLSYRFKGSEPKVCFYANVDPRVDFASAIVQFYYAASDVRGSETVYVDAIVTGPTGTVAHNQKKQSHAEINVKPSVAGEYSLCLSHHGNPSDKNIDVDINMPFPPPQNSQIKMDEETSKLTSTIVKLQGELRDLVHTLRYIKNREHRHLDTIHTISSWVFWVSIFEILLVFGMSGLQITILRTFFSGNSSSSRSKPRI
jgi:hypothetical protein